MSVRGYEIQCSPWTAELLGAWFTNHYRGRGKLHYWYGYLWWVEATELNDLTAQNHGIPKG